MVSSPFVMTTETDYRAVTLVAYQKEKKKRLIHFVQIVLHFNKMSQKNKP